MLSYQPNREVQIGQGALVQLLPFSLAEYERRHASVRSAMNQAGIDAFVSFGPENINYLTGHDTPAYHYVQACLITHDQVPINVLRSLEVSNTLLRTWSRQAIGYADHEEPMEIVANAIRDACGPGCRIGIESESFFVNAKRFRLLLEKLGSFATKVVECQLVEPLRLVKSPEEMVHIKAAARISAAAMRAAIATAAEGVNENDIAGETWNALVRQGGEFPGLPPFIVSGPRTSLGHATWAGHILERGDALAFEIPGVVHRYVAPIFRCGSVGPAKQQMKELARASLSSLEILIDNIRPGITACALHRLSVENFGRMGLTVSHRSGYSVGVNYAPDWGEGHLLSIMDGEERELQEGMVFHLVPGIYIPGDCAVVISETVAVTVDGCECITSFPRDLFVV